MILVCSGTRALRAKLASSARNSGLLVSIPLVRLRMGAAGATLSLSKNTLLAFCTLGASSTTASDLAARSGRSMDGISSCPSTPRPVRSIRSLLRRAASARCSSCSVSSVAAGVSLRSGISASSSAVPAACSAACVVASPVACSSSYERRVIAASSSCVGLMSVKPCLPNSALNARVRFSTSVISPRSKIGCRTCLRFSTDSC